MRCPTCRDTELYAASLFGVQTQRCSACAGVWLGPGRLEEILARSRSGEAGRGHDRGGPPTADPSADRPEGKKRSVFSDLLGGLGGD